jgi:hypothetical protein
MKRTMIGLVLAASLGLAAPAWADHDYGYDGGQYGGERGDDWNNEDYNRNRGRERGAFSPGPFDDSPVTITICAVPDSCPQNPPRKEETPNERRTRTIDQHGRPAQPGG